MAGGARALHDRQGDARMTIQELVERLKGHRTIGSAPTEELEWIARHGMFVRIPQGEIVARQTEPVDSLHIMLTGRIAIYTQRGAGLRRTMEWKEGDVTGILPFSRLVNPPGDTIVEEPVESIMLTRNDLPELVKNCYHVTATMVHIMIDRARQFTSTDLRDEKMISLGKLAAGFAHEVNNPASAAMREVKLLGGALEAADEATRRLAAAGLPPDRLAKLEELCARCAVPPARPLSGLTLADREAEIESWLAAHGLDEGLAAGIAETPAGIDELDALADIAGKAALDAALRWISGRAAARRIVANIELATERVHNLVKAAKGFTHMDRSPDLQWVDLAGGLRDTIALLGGKGRQKSLSLSLQIPDDLPSVRGSASEINQVWMNLIDNAIDASPENGEVTVSAKADGGDVLVSVVDNGGGIPADIQLKIFDPFFTTKPVGLGTGLGLDIARRIVFWHNGEIVLDSRPGRTEFTVRLPVAGAG
jgi:signal transduction histidine kinase